MFDRPGSYQALHTDWVYQADPALAPLWWLFALIELGFLLTALGALWVLLAPAGRSRVPH